MEEKSNRNTYSTKKAMQEYAAEILHQLPLIDRVKNSEEMERTIDKMLELLGKCSGSDRAYIYDRLDENQSIYLRNYEWCAPGVTAGRSCVETLSEEKMPYWKAAFEKGENIIVPEVEELRENMPKEYQFLKEKKVHSEVIIPLFKRNGLVGMIGLDNPYSNLSPLFIQQLWFIGAHLNAARENLNMFTLLEDNLESMEKERQLLMVLCADSTSVFRVNLLENTAEIVKLEQKTNTAEYILNDRAKTETINYYEGFKTYYEQFVIQESAPDFLEIFSPENLIHELGKKERISYRYQSVPNARNQIYFEARATKIQESGDGFQALIEFRNIDEIILDERKHQHELEQALEDARMNNEIISALSKIYFQIFRIDLQKDYYEEVSGNSEEHRLTGRNGKASIQMQEISSKYVAKEYQNRLDQFFHLSTLSERLKNDESIAVEYLAEDGNWHLARFVVQSRDETGKAVRVLFAVRLISEEKRREKHLIGAVEDANRANEAKSEFLSRMSHDIRTPMNAIMGFVNLALLNLDNTEKVKSYLEKIRLSGGNLEQLINDVLDISRIESGEFKIAAQPIQVSELCESCRRTITGMAEERKIHFEIKEQDILRNQVIGDEMRLEQVLVNLLSNAVKYTPEGGNVKLEIREQEIEEKGKIRLKAVVSDTGIGMTPEFMEKMYSEFSRAVDTRVNKVRGSGLGLSIVKKIVDLMGGTIEVESEIQKGTTFRIYLDLPIVGAEQEHPEIMQELPGIVLPERQLHLLIAEDNDLNYEILAEQLELYGIQCIRAVDGRDCVQKFLMSEEGAFDAILMDMQMPEMNGMEATRQIRSSSHPSALSIPVLALTANAYQEDRQRCIDAGMNDHLTKPIKIEYVIQMVMKYLAG